MGRGSGSKRKEISARYVGWIFLVTLLFNFWKTGVVRHGGILSAHWYDHGRAIHGFGSRDLDGEGSQSCQCVGSGVLNDLRCPLKPLYLRCTHLHPSFAGSKPLLLAIPILCITPTYSYGPISNTSLAVHPIHRLLLLVPRFSRNRSTNAEATLDPTTLLHGIPSKD